jgi:hypothetical protein
LISLHLLPLYLFFYDLKNQKKKKKNRIQEKGQKPSHPTFASPALLKKQTVFFIYNNMKKQASNDVYICMMYVVKGTQLLYS